MTLELRVPVLEGSKRRYGGSELALSGGITLGDTFELLGSTLMSSLPKVCALGGLLLRAMTE
jgi:hypothetical protein